MQSEAECAQAQTSSIEVDSCLHGELKSDIAWSNEGELWP